ncbi:MAG: amidohydrolase family protein [Clostridiales bacterium]|jgi:imidazolonepropionase-like amidohydrolase|nr:amidohydrolase family protein [Clostridiales bacterium]
MLIINAHILPINQQEIKRGFIFFDQGKIIALGDMKDAPKWQKVYDAKGQYALPGFIDAHTHLGLFRADGDNEAGEDALSIAPHLRAIDSVDFSDPYFRTALKNGVTSAAISPASVSVFGGQIAMVKTSGEVMSENIGVKVALGDNPKHKNGTPSTRMAVVALIREALAKAKKYATKRNKDVDLASDALLDIINRKKPLYVHCHTQGDIRAIFRVADEFNIDIKLIHATDSSDMASEIKERGVDVICGPQLCHKNKLELAGHDPALAAYLTVNGVKCAITTDHPETTAENLALCASLAMRDGLAPLDALCSITINAAEVCGVADRVGSIEPDKDADILLFDKFPLEICARPTAVFVGGKMLKR